MANRKTRSPSTLDAAAARLRALVLARPEGTLLGSEENLQTALAVSRATVRQAARLLEREGLLRVRRGISGGYFGSRPDVGTIVASVGTYLEMLAVEVEDLSMVATTLWIEVVRKACAAPRPAARALSERYATEVAALPDAATFHDVSMLEAACRDAIFDLLDSRYIELIFQINVAFSSRRIDRPPSDRNDTSEHRDFVRAWRKAKAMELDAIADGDPEMGALAARHNRNLLHRRLWSDSAGAIPAAGATATA
ncbi:GntR family transcriptional regulator [Sphingomonas sp. SUN039]|uniref:GntR family transcriptional regulator n=1 Tax=Sphingomonas sp. SUN039 TaxID=2937787 RepID=UPI00216472B7|nr:GntR family transcriptional regulator [Sphingomonas sp. SUN039]UVO55752.1 GntR family transcriptional regulator [Sphingomonas sp. SUN039]